MLISGDGGGGGGGLVAAAARGALAEKGGPGGAALELTFGFETLHVSWDGTFVCFFGSHKVNGV